MGGDLGPRSTLPAALGFAQQHPETDLLLVGAPGVLPAQYPPNITFLEASDVVAMDDRPAFALRHRRESSMWKALAAVAEGRADACVSAGNTGALMAIGKYLLDTFDGVDRPAICKPVPTSRGVSYVLDLGANVECSARQLLQFGLMGSVLAATAGADSPTVGLLNIGSEETKGNDEIREAAALMEASPFINYHGYVEGDGIFAGVVDVVVCDGFVGNVALKVSEGVARLLNEIMKKAAAESVWTRLAGYFAMPLLRKWHTQFDPARYNGASLVGLQGVVVKSHGSADSTGFASAMEVARAQASAGIPQQINQRVTDSLR